jgi:hypothetical protein
MQRIKSFSLLALLLCLAGCMKYANEYMPDRARDPDVVGDPKGLSAYVSMKDGNAAKHFAGGVDLRAFDGERRKVGPAAAFRFGVDAGAAWKFQIRCESAEAQTVSVRVNGSVIGSFAASGASSWNAAVPAGVLVRDTAALVEVTSQSGLGMLELGFVRP